MKKLLIALVLIAAVAGLCFAQQKYALVIGNADYTGISKLRNPVNDANSVAAALRALGFSVETVLNGNLDKMETAAENFRRKLGASRNTYGFFFYAGHGVQAGGDNYLIPVDAANIQTENHLRQRAVSLQTMLENMNDAGNELNIIVLDACRDNPFGWARPRGLSALYAAGAGIATAITCVPRTDSATIRPSGPATSASALSAPEFCGIEGRKRSAAVRISGRGAITVSNFNEQLAVSSVVVSKLNVKCHACQ